MQRILLIPLILLSTLINTSWAFANEHPQKKLKQINTKIAKIKSVISQDQTKRNTYLKQLKKIEMASGSGLLELQKTSKTIKQKQNHLEQLRQNTRIYQNKLEAQQDWLSQQMRAAYYLGHQPYLKLILSQSEADRISRLLMYYRYITQDRLLAVQQLQQTLLQLHNNQEQIQAATQKLKALRLQQQSAQKKMSRIKEERKNVIAALNNEIRTKNQKLADLLANKRLLEKTINRLERTASVKSENQQGFIHQKGKLPWPAIGKVLPYFGTPVYHSELAWDGILIQAPEDQPIHAVAKGTVVFAKWLPGYGLLLIINHGHGYMTLYGRNHNLYKQPGDVVQQGDLIASVGQSGGYNSPALYFAIRHNAKPLNPMDWCHKSKSRRQ